MFKSAVNLPAFDLLAPPATSTFNDDDAFTVAFDDDDANDANGDRRYAKWLMFVYGSKINSSVVIESEFELLAVANKFMEKKPSLCGSSSGEGAFIDAWSGSHDYVTLGTNLKQTSLACGLTTETTLMPATDETEYSVEECTLVTFYNDMCYVNGENSDGGVDIFHKRYWAECPSKCPNQILDQWPFGEPECGEGTIFVKSFTKSYTLKVPDCEYGQFAFSGAVSFGLTVASFIGLFTVFLF